MTLVGGQTTAVADDTATDAGVTEGQTGFIATVGDEDDTLVSGRICGGMRFGGEGGSGLGGGCGWDGGECNVLHLDSC